MIERNYCYWWAHHWLRYANKALREIDFAYSIDGMRDQSALNFRLRLLQFKADIEEW